MRLTYGIGFHKEANPVKPVGKKTEYGYTVEQIRARSEEYMGNRQTHWTSKF